MIAFNATLLVAILWFPIPRFALGTTSRTKVLSTFVKVKKKLDINCGIQGKSIKQFNVHLPILTHFGLSMGNSIPFQRYFMDNFNAWKI
jgi:hypothetical protein